MENICTAFGTKLPSTVFFGTGNAGTKTPVTEGAPGRESPGPQGDRGSRSGSGSATPTRPGTDEDSQGLMVTGESLPINVINVGSDISASTSPNPALSLDSVQIQPRFESIRESIGKIYNVYIFGTLHSVYKSIEHILLLIQR